MDGVDVALIPLEKLCEPEVLVKYGVMLDPEVLATLDNTSRQKQVRVMGKVYWGDVRSKLCEAVGGLKLDCLVIESRGLGTIQRIKLEKDKDENYNIALFRPFWHLGLQMLVQNPAGAS
ncbi:unnamed protein product [Thlaspi arvense]|uniref:Uncharacterized protein n=1 Tax=Thlaspi arvense TaxID=13288 RepID=A0AAU9RJ22_THLAR|nr:unnamed protein product [Thlaspi arvense]